MGRVGSCFDNAAAEAFFSSLEWEVLSCNRFSDTIHAQAVVIDWRYTFYNYQRRHSAADGLSPVNYEIRESKELVKFFVYELWLVSRCRGLVVLGS